MAGSHLEWVGPAYVEGQRDAVGTRALLVSEGAMAVYVYELRGQRWRPVGLSQAWFGLTADTDDELHAFAARLGLPRDMFRPGTPAGPQQAPVAGHYTLTQGERDRAVGLGAQAISAREADRIQRQRAAGLGYS
jgi:Protein of unknown function (DUF4031)